MEEGNQALDFFVYVVESASPVDWYHDIQEGHLVAQHVRMRGRHCVVRKVITPEAFAAALTIGIHEEIEQYPHHVPILHISAHGDQAGIQLSNGTQVTWKQLKLLLRPINDLVRGELIVCMSSCEGYAGIKMAMHPEDAGYPYAWLVGCINKPTWFETEMAYLTFYHHLQIGSSIEEAATAMRVSSGNRNFMAEPAPESRQFFLEFTRQREEKNRAMEQEAHRIAQLILPAPQPGSKALAALTT